MKRGWLKGDLRNVIHQRFENSGCSHRNRSTGRNEPVEEHEESSLGPAEFEVMVDGNVKETRICHHKIGMLL